jgi:F0F1-type ATP synthase assembly protein I
MPLVTSPRQDGPHPAQAYVWASRASALAGQAVVPVLLGYWADSRWGTGPWLLIVGGALGFVLLMFNVIRLSQPKRGERKPQRPRLDDVGH